MNATTRRYYRILSVLFLFGGLLATSMVHAQAGKSFLDGKTITFLVGSSAGGGTDVTARVIARHIERYLPGKPRIDVANKPGAGGMIAANELYNLKKPFTKSGRSSRIRPVAAMMRSGRPSGY